MKVLSAGGAFFQEVENGQVFLSCVTTRSAALTPLVQSDGSQIAIPNNTAVLFDVLIGARAISGNNVGKVGYYRQTGIAKNIDNVTGIIIGTGGLLSGTTQLIQIEEVVSWQTIVTTSGATLSFQCSGDNNTTVLWKATGQLVYI